jgi:peptide/nickel transport system ATP-binding protein
VCPAAAVMYAGRIVESGPIEALLDAPAHPYTRMLFSATPDIDESLAVMSIPGAPPRLDRPLQGCSFAERCDCTLGRCGTDDPALEVVAAGRVAACHRNASVVG